MGSDDEDVTPPDVERMKVGSAELNISIISSLEKIILIKQNACTVLFMMYNFICSFKYLNL